MRCERSSPSTSSITRACDAAGVFETVDAGDVGMIQRRQEFRLALEAREPIGISGERVGQDLDRDLRGPGWCLSPGRPHPSRPRRSGR